MRLRTAAVAATVAAGGGIAAAVALAADQTVTFVCCQYQPPTVTIQAGEQVTFQPGPGQSFEGSGSSAHPLDFVDPSIPDQKTGNQPVSRRFERPGSYAYFCTLHGTPDNGMAGRVVVAGAASTGTTQTQGTTTTAGPTTTTAPSPVNPTLSRVRISAAASIRLRTLRSRGVDVRVATDGASSFRVVLRRDGSTLGSARGTTAAGGTATVRVRITESTRRSLARRSRSKLTLRVVATGDGRTVSASRRLTVKR